MKFHSGKTTGQLVSWLTNPAFGMPLLRELPLGSVQAIVDLGAHIGMWSLMARFCHPQAKILAVEPFQIVYECLVENAEGMQIDTLRAALGNGSLYCVVNSDGNDMATQFGVAGTDVLDTVPSYGLDQFVGMLPGIPPTGIFWKIDVEGGESILLTDRSAIEILRQSVGFMIDVHAGWKRGWKQWATLFAATHELDAYRSNHNTGALLGRRAKAICNATYHDWNQDVEVLLTGHTDAA